MPNGFFPEEEKKEEEKEKRRRLPTKQEILEKAIELYYKDHPEAIGHRLTPEKLELRAKEGGYLQKAQEELMRGPTSEYVEQLLHYLSSLRREVEKTVEELEHLGEKPEWPPPPPEELIQKETQLLNKTSALEAKLEKTAREKAMLEEKIKTLEQELEKTKMPKEAPKPPEKPPLKPHEEIEQAFKMLEKAVLADDHEGIEDALNLLKKPKV